MSPNMAMQQADRPNEEWWRRIEAQMLESNDRKVFYTKVNTTAINTSNRLFRVEIPRDFLERCGHEFTEDVTFERPHREQKWPIRLTCGAVQNGARRVSAYGYRGWKDFMLDNRIKKGDVLFFALIEVNRFVVYVCRKPKDDGHQVTTVG